MEVAWKRLVEEAFTNAENLMRIIEELPEGKLWEYLGEE
jgi:hypothetical protein